MDRNSFSLRRAAPARPSTQRGMTVVVVLVLLSVMLLGGLALARLTEVGTLVAGNVSTKEASLHAAQVGTSAAFQALRAPGLDMETTSGNWYYPTIQNADTAGVPAVVWGSAPEVTIGRFSARYVVERMCDKAPVVDAVSDCLLREAPSKVTAANASGGPKPDPVAAQQYRISVRVTDQRGTQTWVQTMVNL